MLLLLHSGGVAAHTSTKGAGDLFAGALHPLTTLEHVVLFIALSLLAGQQMRRSRTEGVLLVFPAALIVGATAAAWLPQLPGATLINMAFAIVLGALVALARDLPNPVFVVLVVSCGFVHGLANGAAVTPEIRSYLFIPGVGLAGMAVLAYGMLMTDYIYQRDNGWMRIALQVAGSWIAAIGMLVMGTGAGTMLTN